MAGKFSLDLSRFVARARGNSRAVVRKVVLDLGTSIITRTPVGDPTEWAPGTPVPPGYVGGRARGSWQYAKGAPLSQEPGGVDASGGASISRVAGGVQQGDPLTTHYITSNVPYMRRLEYDGWSRQAPEGMVRKTIIEFQQHVDAAVRSLP